MPVLEQDAIDVGKDFLEHHGVKGMKWGVRRNRRGKIKARATMTKKAIKDSEWLENPSSRGESFNTSYNKTYRAAAWKIRKGIRKINRQPEYKGQNFKERSPLRTKYYRDISSMIETQLNSSATRHGRSPNKKFQMAFSMDVDKQAAPTVTVRLNDTRKGRKSARKEAQTARKRRVSHEDDSSMISLVLPLSLDDSGYITDINIDSIGEVLELDSSEEIPLDHDSFDQEFSDYLEHYGIRGMKWGIRRKDPSGTSSTGRELNAKEVAAAERAAAKSGRKEKIRERKKAVKERRNLSDAELEKRVKRAQLEKQLREATAQDLAPRRTAVKKVLGGAAKTVAATALPALAVYGGRKFIIKYMKNEALANEVFPPKTKKKKGTQDAGKAAVETILRTSGSVKLPTFAQSAKPRS